MGGPSIARWHVGRPRAGVDRQDGCVAFTFAELRATRDDALLAVPFHEAAGAPLPLAPRVDVHFPPYRGMSLVPVLSWLVATRLAAPGADVRWHLDRQQGPDSVRRRLEELGWTLTRDRDGRMVHLCGRCPADAPAPVPAGFTAALGERTVELLADYGVFSPGGIDAGTDHLLRLALAGPPVDAVADVGVGCGPLAIGLVANGVAGSAVGSDVDTLALWLAGENARRCGVALTLACTDDPVELPATALTVCNVPTHLDRQDTERLIGALARRARGGRLLAVVHASLEERYAELLERAGAEPRRHPGPTHVVLEAATRRPDRRS